MKKSTSGCRLVILAKTGAGKTILMKKLILSDEVMANSRQFILDPKNDGYDKVVIEKFNGLSIDVDSVPLNPLALNYENVSEEIIDEKIVEIKEFLYLLFNKEIKTSNTTGLLVSEFVNDIKKFLNYWFIEIKNKSNPSFNNLSKWLIDNSLSQYEFLIKTLTDGTYSKFNVKNEYKFVDKSIVFKLQKVLENPSEEIRNVTMFLILNLIINEIYYRQNKTKNLSLWIDEAGDFFKSEFLAMKLEKLMVKSRSFNTKIGWATQNPTDLINSSNKILNSIFSNTEHLFIGQLKDSQVGAINEMIALAEGNILNEIEKNWIKDSSIEIDKGKFLYFNANKRYRIRSDYLGDEALYNWNEKWKESENRG